MDDDETIDCDSETIEREAVEEDSNGNSADEVTIRPSKALECCIRLSSILSLQQELTKELVSITDRVRKQCLMLLIWRAKY